MSKLRLLIVDDEESVLKMLQDVLWAEGYEVRTADTALKGLDEAERYLPHVVVMDIRMPGMDGLEALKVFNKQAKPPVVVLMTAFAATETAITAIKEGAYDYIIKPFNIDSLLEIVKKAGEMAMENQDSEEVGEGEDLPVVTNTIIGNSEGMQEVYKTIGRVADKNVTVLILGESGTGKEMVAQAVHSNSNRKDKPFIKVNCAAIPENLLESELFGHEKGAFTGAVATKIGKFELANGGTIFLDEIGDMPLAAQVKLLRVIQEKEIERVGGTTHKVDVRIVAATNRDLAQAVQEGTFREDLFYRLNVVPITLPALRQRREDIPLLIDFFARKHCGSMGKEVCTFSQEAIEMLQKYHWPGNVRELENVCQRAMVMAKGKMVVKDDIPYFAIRAEEKWSGFEGLADTFEGITLKELVSEFEKQVILKALDKHNWNRTQTAETLGLNRRSLYAKMKELGLL